MGQWFIFLGVREDDASKNEKFDKLGKNLKFIIFRLSTLEPFRDEYDGGKQGQMCRVIGRRQIVFPCGTFWPKTNVSKDLNVNQATLQIEPFPQKHVFCVINVVALVKDS